MTALGWQEAERLAPGCGVHWDLYWHDAGLEPPEVELAADRYIDGCVWAAARVGSAANGTWHTWIFINGRWGRWQDLSWEWVYTPSRGP